MNKDNLSRRLQAVVLAMTTDYRRFKQLENLTGVQADTWKSWYHGRQRPTAEMIEAAGRTWPEYAFWLIVGISDPEYGHVAPGDQGYPQRSQRKENSANLFRTMVQLKNEALRITLAYFEADGIYDLDPDDTLIKNGAEIVLGGCDPSNYIDVAAFKIAKQKYAVAQKLRRAEILVETEMPTISFEATETLIGTVEELLNRVPGPAKAALERTLNEEKTRLQRHNRQSEAIRSSEPASKDKN